MLTTALLLLLPQAGAATPPKPAPKTAWELLAAKYDANHDGKISRKEYSKADKYFARLDLDGDGEITKADADALGTRAARKPGRTGERGKGRGAAGNDRGAAGRARGAAGEGRGTTDQGTDGKSELTKKIMVAAEGVVAPDFNLPRLLSQQSKPKSKIWLPAKTKFEPSTELNLKALDRLKLSSFRDKKPVALIFGSYT
jgi:EF hand